MGKVFSCPPFKLKVVAELCFFWFPRAGVGTDSICSRVPLFFWFPRAGVGTDSICSRVPFFLWPATLAHRECVPTPARGNEKRRRVGTRKIGFLGSHFFSGSHAPAWEPIPFAPASRFFSGSHAPAWEPICSRVPFFLRPATLAHRECVPTPARGNEKRRRVGTSQVGRVSLSSFAR